MKFPLPKKYHGPALLALVLLLSIPLVIFRLFIVNPSGSGQNIQIVEFGKGQTLKKFAPLLEERKLIKSAAVFVLYARLRGDDGRLKAGYYQFNDAMPPAEILRRMVAGEVYEQRFAVPEGYSIYQIAEMLAGRHLFDKDEFL